MPRIRKTYGKKTPPENLNYREPPKPIHYYTAEKGHCRFCGLPIFNEKGEINTRANWHKGACIETYLMIWQPKYAKKSLYKKEKGVCQKCGKKCGRKEWHMDHIQPLFLSKNGDIENYDFWKIDNLQTLCHNCHKEKSSLETSYRASIKLDTEYLLLDTNAVLSIIGDILEDD